jgi:glycosyltransferase involved in cell wall biosynthesis
MKQNYSNDDPFRFIDDIQKYIVDRRYIRIDGIPVILAYNPGHIPNVRDVFVKWRNHAEKIGIGKIKIWICKTFGHTPETLHIQDVVDGLVEFPPHGIPYVSTKDINLAEKKAYIYDYKELVFEINKEITSGNKNHESFDKIPLYHTCMLGWDNAARKKNEWSTYAGFSLKVFYEWALLLTRKALKTPNNIFFINAWNEWAEGTYLEPDKKYGYTNINTLSKAIFGLDFNDNNLKQIEKKHNKSIIFVGHDAFNAGAQLLAINIIRQLREIFKYDVYTVLKTGGVLVDDFKTSSTDLIILDDYNMKDFKDWVNSTNTTISICNTVITGDILHILTEYGINCISLIHEMEKIIHQYSCESKLKLIVADALKIVFPSNFVKKSNEKIITIPDEKTIIRPQGLFAINSYMNEHEKIRSIIRIKHNIPQNGKIVLGMGYGDYRKGFDLFLQCMMKVCNVYKDIYFVWVGDIYFNDEALQGYNDIINEYKQNNRLTLPGYVKEYLKYYVAADIFLLTSREDPFPIVVMDAIYANLPVVAFKDGGGYVEIINEKTGILVTMENTDIMSEHICKLLDSDILDKRTINYGYNIIKENFSFVNYLFILLSLLGEQYKKVSVIIPNYNYAKYLKERIDSILSQTFPVYEIIILDDYSTDDSLSVIDEYLKEYPLRIELIKNNENSGNVFKQWEKGIEAAKGDYIWIAEADDLSEPTFLETLINKMSLDESIVIGYTQSKSIDEHGNITGDNYLSYTDKIDTIWRNDYIADGIDEIENRLSVKNTILNVSAVIFKNENLLEIIKNAKNYSVAGDWRFYVDLLMKGGKLLFIADSLNIQRRHENSVTKKLNVKKHFDEICEMQDYIYRITKNRKYFDKAKEYRKEVKEYLRIYE